MILEMILYRNLNPIELSKITGNLKNAKFLINDSAYPRGISAFFPELQNACINSKKVYLRPKIWYIC
jgi:hypothetical protein